MSTGGHARPAAAADLAWHGGPAPAPGWFPASYKRSADILRFWDGQRWSICTCDDATEAEAGMIGSEPEPKRDASHSLMEWRHQPRDWPENARTYPR